MRSPTTSHSRRSWIRHERTDEIEPAFSVLARRDRANVRHETFGYRFTSSIDTPVRSGRHLSGPAHQSRCRLESSWQQRDATLRRQPRFIFPHRRDVASIARLTAAQSNSSFAAPITVSHPRHSSRLRKKPISCLTIGIMNSPISPLSLEPQRLERSCLRV